MMAHFADTSYYVALIISQDVNHARVHALTASLRGQVITTNYVLFELAAYFSKSPLKAVLRGLINDITQSSKVIVVPESAALLKRAWEIYFSHTDKNWSLTDCTSFLVMADRGIHDALTSDHHFSQAGFRVLLTSGL